jgi:hypothetical protein
MEYLQLFNKKFHFQNFVLKKLHQCNGARIDSKMKRNKLTPPKQFASNIVGKESNERTRKTKTCLTISAGLKKF